MLSRQMPGNPKLEAAVVDATFAIVRRVSSEQSKADESGRRGGPRRAARKRARMVLTHFAYELFQAQVAESHIRLKPTGAEVVVIIGPRSRKARITMTLAYGQHDSRAKVRISDLVLIWPGHDAHLGPVVIGVESTIDRKLLPRLD